MKVIITDTVDMVRDVFADRIASELERNTPVLFLASGGSTGPVAASICERLSRRFSANKNVLKWLFTVSLVDERFGAKNHPDSNWRLLLDNGLNTAEMSAIPILRADTATDADLSDAVAHYDSFLREAADRHGKGDVFISALFGIGKGGFTAGILPESPAAKLKADGDGLATSYKSALFTRITVTPAFFRHIDYAAVWATGAEKRPAIAALAEDTPYEDQPAQLLKRVRDCVIFTDREGNPDRAG